MQHAILLSSETPAEFKPRTPDRAGQLRYSLYLIGEAAKTRANLSLPYEERELTSRRQIGWALRRGEELGFVRELEAEMIRVGLRSAPPPNVEGTNG